MVQKIIYQQAQQDNYQIYNKNVSFTLENYGLVKMIFLEFTASADFPGTITSPTPTSPYLIKNVFLESYGNIIANNTTSYILGRLDELDYDLYKQMFDGCSFAGGVLVGDNKIISLPLFFWVIDGQLLDTRKYTNLTVRCITKDSFQQMGLDGNLTALSIRLKVIYDDPKLYVETPLKNSYNCYRVSSVHTAGAIDNTITVKINNPFIVSNIYFMLRKVSNARIKGIIKSIKLSTPTGEIGTYDNITNYYLGKKNSANFSNTFAIQLADRYRRGEDYFQATGQSNPMIAEIVFYYEGANSGDYNLYIASEYYSNIEESGNMLIESIPGSFVRF